MDEWRVTSLGDLISLEYGRSLPEEARTGSGFPVFGSNGVVGHHIEALVPGPGIIVGRKGSVGALQWSDCDFWPIDTAYWVRPIADIDLRWMREALRLAELNSLDSSTGVPGLNRDDAYIRALHVPPLEEQRRIAEAIDAVDEAIRSSERVCAKLNALGNALLTHLALQCADSGIPVPLNSTGIWLSGGTPSTSEPSFWDGPIPWITASSLRSKYLSCSSRTLTAAGVSAGSRLVPPGTLICVVRGMSLKSEFRVGIAAVELAFGQDCKALRVTDDWLPEYLHLQLAARQSDVLRLVDEASHGTGRLQMQLLGALLVDRVSLGEQQRVLTLYRAHEERVAAEEAGLAKLRQLRAGLAEDLLSGRVRTVAA